MAHGEHEGCPRSPLVLDPASHTEHADCPPREFVELPTGQSLHWLAPPGSAAYVPGSQGRQGVLLTPPLKWPALAPGKSGNSAHA
eukprot:4367219-Prymnesium_polylepis.2